MSENTAMAEALLTIERLGLENKRLFMENQMLTREMHLDDPQRELCHKASCRLNEFAHKLATQDNSFTPLPVYRVAGGGFVAKFYTLEAAEQFKSELEKRICKSADVYVEMHDKWSDLHQVFDDLVAIFSGFPSVEDARRAARAGGGA